MPGKLGKPREPPRSSEHPPSEKNLRAPLFPFVPLHFHRAGGALFGLWHTCKITEVCSQLRCLELFASQRREQQEPRGHLASLRRAARTPRPVPQVW